MPPPQRRRPPHARLHPSPPLLLLASGLVTSFAILLWQTRRLYFFGDEWAFLLSRSLSWDDLLEPHNEHWTTLPLIAYRLMFHVLGIDHHLAYAMGPLLLHVGICLLLYALMRRHEIPPWPAVLATLLLAFACGNLGENLLWAFQITFLGSAFFGLAAILLLEALGSIRLALAASWVCTVLSMMCSGMALPMLVLLGLVVLSTDGFRRALLATVPPFLVYLAWYAAFGRHGVKQAPEAGLDLVLNFSAAGLASVWEQVLRLPGIGAAAFVGLALGTLILPLPRRTRQLALAGLGACLLTYLLVGFSRAGLGVEAAPSSRYAYFGLLMSLPAFAAVVGLVATRLADDWIRRTVYGAAVLGLAVSGAAQTVSFTDARAALSPRLEQRVLGARELVEEDQVLLSHALDPVYSPNLTTDALVQPDVAAALPDAPASRLGLLDASSALQVAASQSSFDLPWAEVGTHDVSGDLPEDGCAPLRAGDNAWVDVPPSPDGGQIGLKDVDGPLPAQLVANRLVSVPVFLNVFPGETYVGSSTSVATLRLTLAPGRFQLCRD
jgi:hypothetical protein